MGQKINPICFRTSPKLKTWDSLYFAKSIEESSLFVFNNFKIKKYLTTVFYLFYLVIHTLRIRWTKKTLYTSIAYYVTRKRSRVSKKNQNDKIYSSFTGILLESLSNFTKNTSIIILTLHKINVLLKIKYKKRQLKNLKTIRFHLRRFSRLKFFNQTINILLITVRLKNSAQLLTDYIVIVLKTLKKQDFFFFFIKQSLEQLLKLKISRIRGLKLKINGRINLNRRARTFQLLCGSIPLQTINANIAYAHKVLFTQNGSFGINTWIF